MDSESTPVELEEYFQQFTSTIQKEAQHTLHVTLPSKLQELSKMLESGEFEIDKAKDMHKTLGLPSTTASESGKKKRKLEEDGAVANNNSGDPAGGSGAVYLQKSECNQQIQKKIEFIKDEVKVLVDACNKLKVWLQLSIPKIDSGNNFGVSIQEEIIKELATAEDSAFSVLDSISKYYMGRAKLVSKVFKYPNLQDYVYAIREVDEMEWVHLTLCVKDLRSNYSILYDRIKKNWTMLEKPRSNDMAVTAMY